MVCLGGPVSEGREQGLWVGDPKATGGHSCSLTQSPTTTSSSAISTRPGTSCPTRSRLSRVGTGTAYPPAPGSLGPLNAATSSTKAVVRKGVTNTPAPLSRSSWPWVGGKDKNKEYEAGLLLECLLNTEESIREDFSPGRVGGLAGP